MYMNQKIYLFIFGAIAAIVFIFVGIFLANVKTSNQTSQIYPTQVPVQQPAYTINDKSAAPKSREAITYGEIMHETQKSNDSIQKFVVQSAVDGSLRDLLTVDANNLTFENIQPQNWSPTNRFIYIYVDYPKRRDVIFIKTDGTFTNHQYFLHSTGLYPNMNVLSAKWLDEDTLELQTRDIKTNLPQKYLVNFDDDTGIVSPE
jgi:hypothetical protein